MKPPNLSEQELVAAAKQGDQDAFETLIHLYEKKVFALTRRLCANPDDAQEAAQEAFLAAWQGLPFFRGDSSFATWLYRLTSNACMDLLRKEQRHQSAAGPSLDDEEVELPVVASTGDPHAEAERAELKTVIEAGLRALQPEYRTVLLLREIHQRSYDEIADILDLDLGTVKSRINRGRKLLRKFLLESGNFSGFSTSKGTGEEGCR
ncbi:MAG: sigma-70 family RNA polymerase sigma factor [Ruminococcaceae bacterium]|nr:sigma-70 family RNA polymerase sigma factor [Oscillospiraceae bacterium]